jgi:hypothetical protein
MNASTPVVEESRTGPAQEPSTSARYSNRTKWAAIAAAVALLAVTGWYVASGWIAQSQWAFNHQQLVSATNAKVSAEIDRMLMLPVAQHTNSALIDSVTTNLGTDQIVWESGVTISIIGDSSATVAYSVATDDPSANKLWFSTARYDELVMTVTRDASGGVSVSSCALRHGTDQGTATLVKNPIEETPGLWWDPCGANIWNQLGISTP